VSFQTPFNPENIGSPLYNFGFYKIQRHTKSVFVEMLKNFFSNMVQSYRITMPDLFELQNSDNDDNKKIFISQDFPYFERKLPIIIVSLKGVKERKMYIGADNIIGYKTITIPLRTSTGTSTGLSKTVEIYGGAAEAEVALTVIALSPDDRMKICELINMCFTHFYRWQYYYTFGDGNMMTIVPSKTEISFAGESETGDVSKTSMLYINTMNLSSFIEYTFSSQEAGGMLVDYTIDPASGVIEVPFGPIS